MNMNDKDGEKERRKWERWYGGKFQCRQEYYAADIALR
jgi:hypothetical protein